MAREINKEKVLEAYKQATKKGSINGRTTICVQSVCESIYGRIWIHD